MAGNDKRLYKQLSHQDSGSGSSSAPPPSSTTTTTPSIILSPIPTFSSVQALSPPQTFVGSPLIPSGTNPASSPLTTTTTTCPVPSILIRTMSGSSTQGLTGDAPQLRDTISSRTLFYLRSTLTASFQPDYDFSDAKSEEFSRVPSIRWVMDAVQSNLSAAAGEMFTSFEQRLWMAVDEEIRLVECDVYR